MKRIWEAIVAWIVRQFQPRPEPSGLYCQCGHRRCSHAKGKYACNTCFPPDHENPRWTKCSCLLFIEDEGDDQDGEVEIDPAPTYWQVKPEDVDKVLDGLERK